MVVRAGCAMSDAWIALIGTIFTGAGFKAVEHWLGRTKRKDDTATMLRSELRQENEHLRNELEDCDNEVDKWRNRYYSLVSSIVMGDLEGARRKIAEGK